MAKDDYAEKMVRETGTVADAGNKSTGDIWEGLFVMDAETGEVIFDGDPNYHDPQIGIEPWVFEPFLRAIKVANLKNRPKVGDKS